MCQCGVWLRPIKGHWTESEQHLQRQKTPHYRTSVVISRGKKSGHNPWQQVHQKAMDAKRGVLKRGKYTSILDRWQKDEVHRASHLVHGWTDEWVKYRDYISKIDIRHDPPYRQRQPYESTVYVRGVDSNKQAGPLCQRPDYKSSANALVSLQRAQGKGVPHIPIKLRTRQNDTLDPAVQQHLEWLSINWPTYCSSSSSSTWTEKPKVVEFFILGPSVARAALSRVARQRMVGSAITTTMQESSNSTGTRRLVRKSQSDKVSVIVKFT